MFIFVLLSLSSAATITGEVLGPKAPTEKKTWQSSSVKVLLSSSQTSYLTDSHTFTFFNVPDGLYTIEVHDQLYFYKPVIARVSGESVIFKETGGNSEKTMNPLKISAEKRIVYFEERETFSIFSIIYNPMVLMFVVFSLLTFCMPGKGQMDPEQMKEMQELAKQYKSSSWMNSFLTPSFE
jgi:hypothetical protein